MKKITIGICCLALIVLMVSVQWARNAAQTGDALDLSATSLAGELSIEAMVSQSNLIVTGSCLDTRSVWVDRSLVTLATISVKDVLKGDNTSTITVALPGGVDANRKIPVAMTYPGAPRITPTEEVLLFLTSDDGVAGGYTITGFSQGKFSILKDENGQEVVSRDLTRTALKGKNGTRRGDLNRIPLSGLKEQVRRQLTRQ